MLVGVEHEYEVIDRAGRRVDMRTVIDDLAIDGVRADPDDAHAVRCRHGAVITADGAEAEIATPPIEAGPRALDELLAHLAVAEDELQAALGEGYNIVGYSTHLNVEVPDRRVVAVGRRLVERWSPALLLVTQHATSPGLLVRPRWRRLELGCEHLGPDQVRVAMTFAVGAVTSALRRRHPCAPVALSVEPSRQRFGWYVDRAAPGSDVLSLGRAAVVTAGGSSLTAGTHLARAWRTARPTALDRLGPAAIAIVDDTIAGRLPLAVESGPTTADIGGPVVDIARRSFEHAVNGLTVRPLALTWRTAVFEITDADGTRRWIEMPGGALDAFLDDLAAGRLDTALASRRRRLRPDTSTTIHDHRKDTTTWARRGTWKRPSAPGQTVGVRR